MALTGRTPAAIDTAGFIPEVWSAKVLEAVKNELVCVPRIDFRWRGDLKKGDTVNVGILNTVTATEVTVGTPSPIKDIATGAKKQLVVDQWFDVNIAIDEMSFEQAQVNMQQKALVEAKYALAKKIDTSVNTLFSALNGSSVKGTDGSALTDDVLLDIVETLDEADVPREGRSWIVDPSVHVDMLKIDKFVRTDYVREGVVPSGKVGQIYGAPVFITNNLTTYSTGAYACYLHTDAIAFVGSEQIKTTVVHKELEHYYVVNASALWGVKEVRDTFGIPFYTRKA